MTLKDSNGREIEIISIDGEIGEGAYVTECRYVDNDADVPDSIIDWLNDAYQEHIYDEFYQDKVCAAEAWADAQQDR